MDMKEIVEYLQKKGLVFKSFKQVMPKELGSRKKVELYLGIDLDSFYTVVMVLEKKSRVLRKEAEILLELHTKLEQYADTKINKKYLYIKAPLCSKARIFLEESGWKVWTK